MSQEQVPEWFIDIIRGAHGFAIDQQDDGEDHAENFIEEMWRRISKPFNLAKIDSVKALVEACKPEGRDVPNTILGEGFTVFSLNKERIEEALKPFQEGGSDE